MRKFYVAFIALFAVVLVQAQCDPTSYDWMGAEFGISPDAEQGETFSTAELGIAYEDYIYLLIPSNASQVNMELPDIAVDSVQLESILFIQGENEYSLEDMGLTLSCNNLDTSPNECTFNGGQLGCSLISGTPLIAGEFTTAVNVVVYGTVFEQVVPYPFSYEGYTFTVEGGDGVAELISNVPVLHQNIPNPADKTTSIRIDAPNAGTAELELVTMLGEVVYSSTFDMKSGSNLKKIDTSKMPSGIYFYRLKAEGKVSTLRLVVSH